MKPTPEEEEGVGGWALRCLYILNEPKMWEVPTRRARPVNLLSAGNSRFKMSYPRLSMTNRML